MKRLVAALVCVAFLVSAAYADKKPGSSSSKPSSSSRSSFGSSSTKSSKPSGDKPLFGSGSSSKNPSGDSGSGSKPLFGSTATKTETPKTESKPLFGSTKPAEKPAETKPLFGSTKPAATTTPASTKPTVMSEKAKANFQETQRKKYETVATPTQPPKTTYTSPTGKTVNVDTKHPATEQIRQKPYSYYAPEARQQRTTVYIERHHYHHDYGWYNTQPVVYVGGGYSSAFWWMMMSEWDADRRARWLYNNQANIDHEAYMRGLQDAQVAQRIAAMKGQPDPHYVDPDVKDDPSIMYDQHHIDAVYNAPEPAASGGGTSFFAVIGIIAIIGLVLAGLYFLIFRVRVSD